MNNNIVKDAWPSITERNGKDKWIYTLTIYRMYDESDS